MQSEWQAEAVIERLGLVPLPGEGGYYRQTYVRAGADPMSPDATAIYYLVTRATFSAMHRVAHDEIFHFYFGDAVEMLHLMADGSVREVRMGGDVLAGEVPQVVVAGSTWQGLSLAGDARHGFALMGTTMTPGYSERGFELGERAALTARYPSAAARIRELTRG